MYFMLELSHTAIPTCIESLLTLICYGKSHAHYNNSHLKWSTYYLYSQVCAVMI